MVRRVKSYKAGYVVSDSNLAPTATLHDVLELKARTGHSTIAVTADGTPGRQAAGYRGLPRLPRQPHPRMMLLSPPS